MTLIAAFITFEGQLKMPVFYHYFKLNECITFVINKFDDHVRKNTTKFNTNTR